MTAVREGIEYFQHAGIEVDRCELQPARTGGALVEAIERRNEMSKHSALDHDAFRLARGARGIDHIGGACRGNRGLRERRACRSAVQEIAEQVHRTIDGSPHAVDRLAIDDYS